MGQSIVEPSGFDLSKAELSALESIGSQVRRPKDQILIEDGENSDHVLFLLSGYVKILISWPKRAVAIRGPGYFIGEMAAIRTQPRTARVESITDVSMLIIQADRFLEFLLTYPKVMLGLLRETDERLLEATRKTAEAELTTEMRLLRTLVELTDKGLGQVDEGRVRLSFNQQDLGELGGAKHGSVAKAMRSFKDRGLIEVGRGSITIIDLDAVRRLAAADSTVEW